MYKGYLFYNQDGARDLIVYSVDRRESKVVAAPEDAACCEMTNSLYNVKHSGYFDFEVDEYGLWLIYKLNANFEPDYEIAVSNYSTQWDETFVIAKIDDSHVNELKIERKWYIRANRENVANMFVVCGQLYALKNTLSNPASIYKLCDLVSSDRCSNAPSTSEQHGYETRTSTNLLNITISSRQITSLAYNPDRKLLYVVDGGSFAYYKMNLV